MLFLTRFLAKNPKVLSKSFSLDDKGALVVKPGGMLWEGTARETRLPDISAFRDLLVSLRPNEGLSYGVTNRPSSFVVPLKNLAKNPSPDKIARSRQFFSWPTGPGILMLDYDPLKGQPPLSREELLQKVYHAWPALAEAPHIWRPSTSSCLYNKKTGQEIHGIRGQRIYVPLQKGSDIVRTGKVLFDCLWLQGDGQIVLSKSGAELTRTIIDASVFEPTRLDFAGGAACDNSVEQRLPFPVLYNETRPFINSLKTLPNMSREQKNRLEEMKKNEKILLSPKRTEIRDTWIEKRKKYFSSEILEKAVQENILSGTFVIFTEGGSVTVNDILKNPNRWHGVQCLDPLEPEYKDRRLVGWINLRGTDPYINSFAHGGVKYKLEGKVNTIEKSPDRRGQKDLSPTGTLFGKNSCQKASSLTERGR